MANNLYPLTYKPGIKRDGTTFQADYCTDGQWIRFQRGFIRKMGGMKGVFVNTNGNRVRDGGSIYLTSSLTSNNIRVYTAGSLALQGIIETYEITPDFELVPNSLSVVGNIIGDGVIWQNEVVIQGNTSYLIFLCTQSANDISSNSLGTLRYINLTSNQFVVTDFTLHNDFNRRGLSGLLFASNYLFVYGSNGLVQWSKPNNPLDFSNAGARQITISNDKVIYAQSIRGGINNPAILFWTMSSVVRCINNPTATTPPDTLAFQVDVISKSSSILSSRCVVEYDGRFFWPGNNRFFHYNGIVDELPNTMSLNYFFNNIDMRFRQNVFGVRHSQYGEIWWFYPEKLGTPGRLNVPEGKNSRALIYNVRESCWYDTAISRDCAIYSDYFGFMASFGKPLTNLADGEGYLFRHEYETFSSFPLAIRENYPPAFSGTVVSRQITSNFTTPTISWAAFNAMKQLTGVNRWMYLITIEPDFTLMPATTLGADMTVAINTKQYAQDFPVSSQPYRIPLPLTNGQDPSLAKVDTAWQGRYLTLTFTTTVNFEMGQVILQLGIGDGQ